MDRLEAMSLLVAAVETGSFSAASRRLGVPLPTVSRKIAKLEAHLNTRLLVRTTRKLALTDSGAAYLAAAKTILEQVDIAERTAGSEYVTPKGDLALSAPIVFGRLHVLPVVSAFLAAFPESAVRMALSDRNVHLVEDHIDLAVRIGELPDSSMVATKVGSVRRVLCGSPRYFKQHGTPKTPADLADHRCITLDVLAAGSAWSFAARGRKKSEQSVPVRYLLAVNTAEAAIDAAIAGVGLTQVLSYQVARAVSDGKLRVVLADFERTPSPVSLLHAGQQPLPLKVRSFLEVAAPRLRKSLPQ